MPTFARAVASAACKYRRRATIMRSMRRAMAVAAAITLAALAPALAQAGAKRIVSVNLCTDQLLLALGDRGQIASLSPLSSDRTLSYLAQEAKGLPVNRGTGEDVIRLAADLVLLGPFDNRATRALIAEHGIETLVLGPWRSLEEGRAQIRVLGARLGQQARAEALIARMDAALARLRAVAPAKRRVLVLQRRLFAVGRDNLVSDLLAEAGLVEVSPELGVGAGGFVGLERLLRIRPEYLVVAPGDETDEDQGSALMLHEGLRALFPDARRLRLPDRLTVCGGPSTPELIDTLAREIRERVR